MSDVLKRIYNNCDPYRPATEQFYLDCSAPRGSSALSREFQRHLSRAEDYLCFLFSGHIGCGKSSELVQLTRALAHPAPPNERFFPVLLDVLDYLDDYDVAVTDILLAIVTELAAELREKLQIELKQNYFQKRFDEIKEYLLSDASIDQGELTLATAKVKVERLKRDPEARRRVRAALEPRMGMLLDEINSVLDEARLAVKKAVVPRGHLPYADIIILADNLEKIRRLEGMEEGLPSQRELFLERYTQLTGLNAHFLYTVPLRLIRSPDGPQLEQRYGRLFVLPMVKVIERGSRRSFADGVACMRELLRKRLGDLPLEEACTPEALDFLLTYSGGHVRNLMAFVQAACADTDTLPISLPVAHRSIQQTVRTYSTAIPEAHWEKLASLDGSPDQKIPNGDDDYLTMLENVSVLEYINGDGEDPFSVAEPWYAVNPIVRELQKFKAARAGLAKAVGG